MSISNQAIVDAYKKGYRANENGDIIGLKGKILKLSKGTNGYLMFGSRFKGVTKSISVHRFVAYCKYGDELFEAECVRHVDSNRDNNSFKNIELSSIAENFDDNCESWKIRFARAGAHTRRKLSDEQVVDIKKSLGKDSYSILAKRHNVSIGTIQQIKEGKSYDWIKI